MLKLTMNRDDAWTLLNEYTKSESLLKHALAYEPNSDIPIPFPFTLSPSTPLRSAQDDNIWVVRSG